MIQVFVTDPENPGPPAQTAIRRAEAVARRLEGRVTVQVLALDSPEAQALGAALEPTVAVQEMLIAIGQPPMAGHLLRAVEAALESNT